MKLRVLAIDDDADVQLAVEGVLMSLGHDYEIVADQESAQKLLDTKEFDLTLLDLEIPVAPEQKARRENGINLLANIRKAPRTAKVPVIVLTGHGGHSPELAVRLMKMGADDYVLKPIGDGRLDQAIREMESKMGKQSARNLASAPALTLTPFSAAPRELVIYNTSVNICGVEIWRESHQSDMRKMLVLLGQKENGRYVEWSGGALSRELGRQESNGVGRPIKYFRDSASTRLREKCQLDCGLADVIGHERGYFFQPWVNVRIETANDTTDVQPPPAAIAGLLGSGISPAQKLRLLWIMEKLEKGVQLRMPDIEQHTRMSRSAINRDLKVLRDSGLIAMHPEGYYTRLEMPMANSSDDQGARIAINR